MMFLGRRKLGNICCGHKIFLNKIRNIFCVPDTKFVSTTNVARAGKRGNICVGNNVSSFARAFKEHSPGIKPRPNDRNMPTQHIATLLGATCCVRLATVLRHVATCCDMLAIVGSSLKLVKSEPTTPNMSQHVATCRNTGAKRTQHVAPNNVATCCVGMLRSFGQGLTPCCFNQSSIRPNAIVIGSRDFSRALCKSR